MLHRFRVEMVRTSRESLSGEIEVDETMIGGVEKGGKRGRGANKEIVVTAVEIKHPKGYGRIRMALIKGLLLGNISNRIWRNLLFDSIDVLPEVADNCFADCWSRLSRHNPSPKPTYYTGTNGIRRIRKNNQEELTGYHTLKIQRFERHRNFHLKQQAFPCHTNTQFYYQLFY